MRLCHLTLALFMKIKVYSVFNNEAVNPNSVKKLLGQHSNLMYFSAKQVFIVVVTTEHRMLIERGHTPLRMAD